MEELGEAPEEDPAVCSRCGEPLRGGRHEGYCAKCLPGDGLESIHGETEALVEDGKRTADAKARVSGKASPTQEPRQIGPYRLLKPLGEGGMGEVWLADQLEPVRRRVALKLIKPGLNSTEIAARFEAERQALAMMDHSHIAKVFDAGTTEDGRPFFVMELIDGEPITDYCDQRALPIRKRLELFAEACTA
ncbi:MAG: serine/threonine protein kinase, partial [Verrucomicrobiales bacterium]